MSVRAFSLVAIAIALIGCGESAESEPAAASSGAEVSPVSAEIVPPTEAPATLATPEPAQLPVGTPVPPEVATSPAPGEPSPPTAAAPGASTSFGSVPASTSPTGSGAARGSGPAAATSQSPVGTGTGTGTGTGQAAPVPAAARTGSTTPVNKAGAPTGASPAPLQPSAAEAPPPPRATPAANAPGRVIVDIAKLESDEGKIQAALFRAEAGFPDNPAKAALRKMAKIKNRRVELVFENVPPGPFAVLVHHDENGDAKMQTGLFGQPAEGYAISRDAPASFGPPSYEDAVLKLAPGETKRIVVKMRY